MKYLKRLVLPLLFCLLCLLAACGASETEPGITGELGQRYEPIELRWQTATFRALAYPEDEAWQPTAAGLHAVTNRLIVVYTHQETGAQFWLECHTLNDTQARMVRDRDMPARVWTTNAETPEARCEFLLPSRRGVSRALALCSDTMTEEEILAAASQVTVWIPEEIRGETYSCTDKPTRYVTQLCPWTTEGDHAPDVNGDLAVRLYTRNPPFTCDGTWRMQQLVDGRWRDMDLHGDGITCSDRSAVGLLHLNLPIGYYRVMVSIQDATEAYSEIPYAFRVLR